MTDPTPAPALTDEQIDIVADAFNAHPMLLGYREADRMLIAGTLAIAAVRALDLAAVIARAKREAAEEIAQAIDRLHDTVYQARHVPELDPLRVDTACEAYRDGAAIARRIGADHD